MRLSSHNDMIFDPLPKELLNVGETLPSGKLT